MKKYQNLGSLIKDYRAYSNISQSDLSSILDVDVRSVIRWEKNETLLSLEKERALAFTTFIPYQVIRNLNTTNQIPTFYDFDLRKYSLSSLSSKLPDADWIKARINLTTERLNSIKSKAELEDIIRFTELQRNPLKSLNTELIWEAANQLPELNLILLDQSGCYAGHCVYFSLSLETYTKIKNREIEEHELQPYHLVNYKTQKKPIFYCHSITADCNENFFYIIGTVLKFFRETDLKDYLYALLTSRYDSHNMSLQLGIKTVWEDHKIKAEQHLLDAPRLVEGTFNSFFKD